MVIESNGEKVGIMPIEIALKRAQDQGLDLVEVAPNAKPPVCKILDYGKYKYQQKKKKSEARKHQTRAELKEVKLRPKTDDHDYEFKLKHVRRFLESGDKVKVTVMFRGREIIHKDIAIDRLREIAKNVDDIAKVEVEPRMEARTMHMILAPDAVKLAKRKKEAERKAAEGTPPEGDAPNAEKT